MTDTAKNTDATVAQGDETAGLRAHGASDRIDLHLQLAAEVTRVAPADALFANQKSIRECVGAAQ